jgi:hypothetical protein
VSVEPPAVPDPSKSRDGRAERIGARLTAVPRLLLDSAEASLAFGVSLDSFERHVKPTLKSVHLGTIVRFRPADLDEWAERNAGTALD